MSSKFIYVLIIVAVIAGGYGLYHKMNRDTTAKTETLAQTSSSASLSTSATASSGSVAEKETSSNSTFIPFSVTRALTQSSDEKSSGTKCTVDSAIENNKKEIGEMFGKTMQKLMLAKYDTNHDGVVSHEEREVMRGEMMEMRDKVENLYEAEGKDVMRKDMEQTFRRVMVSDFQKYDADRDQILSSAELDEWSQGIEKKVDGKNFSEVLYKEIEQTRSQRRAGELGL